MAEHSFGESLRGVRHPARPIRPNVTSRPVLRSVIISMPKPSWPLFFLLNDILQQGLSSDRNVAFRRGLVLVVVGPLRRHGRPYPLLVLCGSGVCAHRDDLVPH